MDGKTYLFSETMENFLLFMAFSNGIDGELKYSTRGSIRVIIDKNIYTIIEKNWKEIMVLCNSNIRIFTNEFFDIIFLSTINETEGFLGFASNYKENYYQFLEIAKNYTKPWKKNIQKK